MHTQTLSKLEMTFFETLDLLSRLKLGTSDVASVTDSGSQFVNDCFELLCNIMRGDEDCFFKLCEYYRSVQASLPEGASVESEALATHRLVSEVFTSMPL